MEKLSVIPISALPNAQISCYPLQHTDHFYTFYLVKIACAFKSHKA